MSDTPRTQAAMRHESNVDSSWLFKCQFVVPARLAEELEREVNRLAARAKEDAERMRDQERALLAARIKACQLEARCVTLQDQSRVAALEKELAEAKQEIDRLRDLKDDIRQLISQFNAND